MTPYRFPATPFCEQVVQYNNLAAKKFVQWAFYPGMLFQSKERWWGNGGLREMPHEGIDLCLYTDQSGSTRALDVAAPIPVMYRGCVRHIIDDYLGKTIFMAHEIFNDAEKQLYSIYGHIEPPGRIARGMILEEGEIVGSIAGTEDRRFKIIPHVHISVAWISRNFPPEQLNWQSMNESPDIMPLNPLDTLKSNYTVL
jgi:hypothetical protein